MFDKFDENYLISYIIIIKLHKFTIRCITETRFTPFYWRQNALMCPPLFVPLEMMHVLISCDLAFDLWAFIEKWCDIDIEKFTIVVKVVQ